MFYSLDLGMLIKLKETKMNITFGNETNRDYYRIEYLLEEKGNFGFCYPYPLSAA